jgi:N-acetylmuramoyl-L-alanine amidase
VIVPATRRRPPSRRRFPSRLSVITILLLAALLLLALRWYRRDTGPVPIGDAAEFSAGACLEYPPTGPDKHLTVFLDPGHGGPDTGAQGMIAAGKAIDEKTETLAVALDMLPLLQKAGYHVALSRTGDTSVVRLRPAYVQNGLYSIPGEHADIEARIDCANAAHAQLLLSIHFNAFDDPSVGGSETLYDDARPFSGDNLRFAQLVQQSVLSQLASDGWQVPDRGVTPDSQAGTPSLTAQAAAYGHLLELGPAQPGWLDHPSQMPGALVEPLFLTDPNEVVIASSSAGQQSLARGLVEAIEEYFARPTHSQPR